MKRDYQTILFSKYTIKSVDYIPGDGTNKPLQALIYTPDGDTETKRAFITVLPGGGTIGVRIGSMEWLAKQLTAVGYVVAEFDPGNSPSEFDNIAHGGCFNRYMHKNHSIYGIAGGKFFGFGESLGGSILWAENICLDVILTDPRFANTVNTLYPNAKMSFLGTASMPGGVDDIIYKYINSTCVNHLDSHGDKDDILPLQKSLDAVTQMVRMGATKSRVDVYQNAGHDLTGLRPAIIQNTITFFADLMGLPIIPPA